MGQVPSTKHAVVLTFTVLVWICINRILAVGRRPEGIFQGEYLETCRNGLVHSTWSAMDIDFSRKMISLVGNLTCF